jgi:hypothetical protein
VETAERSRGGDDGSELQRRVERKTREMVERSASALGMGRRAARSQLIGMYRRDSGVGNLLGVEKRREEVEIREKRALTRSGENWKNECDTLDEKESREERLEDVKLCVCAGEFYLLF